MVKNWKRNLRSLRAIFERSDGWKLHFQRGQNSQGFNNYPDILLLQVNMHYVTLEKRHWQRRTVVGRAGSGENSVVGPFEPCVVFHCLIFITLQQPRLLSGKCLYRRTRIGALSEGRKKSPNAFTESNRRKSKVGIGGRFVSFIWISAA
jgi:hypothetical protein